MQIYGYIPVPVSTLFPSKVMGVSLYIRDESGGPIRLYRGSEYPFEPSDVERLVNRGVKRLFVSCDEHRRYQVYLRENLDAVLEDESLSVVQRFENLNEVVRDSLVEAFDKEDIGETIETTRNLGKYTVDLISRDDVVVSDLCKVLYHDYHTFTHSANVAYYCVMLAKALGIRDENELNVIATGALLHDIGKLKIPEGILTKPGRLSKSEFETIKSHPAIGFQALAARSDLSPAQLMMVYQHHERLDGTGYPVAAMRREVHDWARICAVADVYEALTSNRPYRQGSPGSEAIAMMEEQTGSAFDESVLTCWKAIIAKN